MNASWKQTQTRTKPDDNQICASDAHERGGGGNWVQILTAGSKVQKDVKENWESEKLLCKSFHFTFGRGRSAELTRESNAFGCKVEQFSWTRRGGGL